MEHLESGKAWLKFCLGRGEFLWVGVESKKFSPLKTYSPTGYDSLRDPKKFYQFGKTKHLLTTLQQPTNRSGTFA